MFIVYIFLYENVALIIYFLVSNVEVMQQYLINIMQEV